VPVVGPFSLGVREGRMRVRGDALQERWRVTVGGLEGLFVFDVTAAGTSLVMSVGSMNVSAFAPHPTQSDFAFVTTAGVGVLFYTPAFGSTEFGSELLPARPTAVVMERDPVSRMWVGMDGLLRRYLPHLSSFGEVEEIEFQQEDPISGEVVGLGGPEAPFTLTNPMLLAGLNFGSNGQLLSYTLGNLDVINGPAVLSLPGELMDMVPDRNGDELIFVVATAGGSGQHEVRVVYPTANSILTRAQLALPAPPLAIAVGFPQQPPTGGGGGGVDDEGSWNLYELDFGTSGPSEGTLLVLME
jgi:hypothetical protein